MARGFAAGLVGLVMLSGCDQAGRAELEGLRTELSMQAAQLASQQVQITALEAALEEERDARARSEARREAAAAAVETEEKAPIPTLNTTCVDNHCVVPRAELEALLASPAGMMRMARVVPEVKDGVTQGLKVYAIRASSPLAKLGLKNGDLVRSVGGVALDTPEAMMTAYTTVPTRDRWQVEVVRHGQPFEISIELR